MIDRNHPAVEAVAREIYVHDAPSNDPQTWPPTPTALADDYRGAAIAAIAAALPHLTADADHPWEPLDGPVHVGDEVRQDYKGFTITAVVARVDEGGDPWTAECALIGLLCYGTWYVRRAVQELPTAPGTVIAPADGHEYITATVGGATYRAREAILIGKDDWHAAWRSDAGVQVYVTPERITPGTWKVGNR